MKVPSKRILCVCSGGNVRSVSLAYILRRLYKYDAIACGIKGNSPYTLDMLYKWADRIIILEGEFRQAIPERFWPKVVIYEVGKDVWHQPMHPELMDKLYKLLGGYKI